MAYLNCPKCGMKFHEKAVACPKCKITPEEHQKWLAEVADRQEKRAEKLTKEKQSNQSKKTTKNLTTCRDCGKTVSVSAKLCPNCGAPVKAKTSGCAVIFLVIILIGIFAAISSDNSTEVSNPVEPAEPISRKEKLQQGFSAWDGSHRALTRIIKKSMNDPDSYEHDETVYWDQGDHIIVETTFRGRNAFGGIVKNWVKAKADLEGNIILVLEQGP